MNHDEYRETVRDLHAEVCKTHSRVHELMDEIKNGDSGMDDRWGGLYNVNRLLSVASDLLFTEIKRGQ